MGREHDLYLPSGSVSLLSCPRGIHGGGPGTVNRIYVRVIEGTGFIGKAISFSTRSWGTHAEFIYVSSKSGLWVTYGAREDGVHLRPADYCKPKRQEWFEFPGADKALLHAATQENSRYDFSAIFGLGIDRDWREVGRWFCSELIAWAFEECGQPIFDPEVKVWRVTPRDLLLARNKRKVEPYALAA